MKKLSAFFLVLAYVSGFCGDTPVMDWIEKYGSHSPYEAIVRLTYLKEFQAGQLEALKNKGLIQFGGERYRKEGGRFVQRFGVQTSVIQQVADDLQQDASYVRWNQTLLRAMEERIKAKKPEACGLTIIHAGLSHGVEFFLNQLRTRSLKDYNIVYAIDPLLENSPVMSPVYEEIFKSAPAGAAQYVTTLDPSFADFADPANRYYLHRANNLDLTLELYAKTLSYLQKMQGRIAQQDLFPGTPLDRRYPDAIIYLDTHHVPVADFYAATPTKDQFEEEGISSLTLAVEGLPQNKAVTDISGLAYLPTTGMDAKSSKAERARRKNSGEPVPEWLNKFADSKPLERDIRLITLDQRKRKLVQEGFAASWVGLAQSK